MSLNRRQLINRSGAAERRPGGRVLRSRLARPRRRGAHPGGPGGRRGSSRRWSRRPATCSRCPPGFTYEVVAVSGETDIHDGTGTLIGKTPERPDGTLVVALPGTATG